MLALPSPSVPPLVVSQSSSLFHFQYDYIEGLIDRGIGKRGFGSRRGSYDSRFVFGSLMCR